MPGSTVANPPAPPPSPHSDAVLDRLTRLHPKLIDLSLGRIERLLARLNHPERHVAPVVHVAGTNGKGSVIAYLRAMLEAAGARVQAYTSPHLVRFHERIRLADGPIEEAALVALLEECEAANGGEPITFFEITTAAAFLAFARAPADILLLETGLGGRLDSTNVIDRPRLCVLTPISIDHVQYLGSSLEAIAFEKTGILKPGVPAVVGPQEPSAEEVIATRAAPLGVPLYRHGREWSVRADGDGLVYQGRGPARRLPHPVLPGVHQIDNAGMALACAEVLEECRLDATATAAGLARAEWPGRLQRLSRGPLAKLLPHGWELWLDGGHNAAAGLALGRVAECWRDRPLYLVYGMLNSKAAGDFLRPLAPWTAALQAVAVPGEAASLSAEEAAALASGAGFAATAADSVTDAIRALVLKPGPARILICGSLYLAGRVLADNG